MLLTVFENKKSHLTLSVDKSSLKVPKLSILTSFCGKTVLPDKSILIVQKLIENLKIKKWDIFGIFQTMCNYKTVLWAIQD